MILGVEPAAVYAAGGPLPDRMSEVDFVGALIGEPVEVVTCETVDLEVPTSTEIVIEGHVSVTEFAAEGPMGEYGGCNVLVGRRGRLCMCCATVAT